MPDVGTAISADNKAASAAWVPPGHSTTRQDRPGGDIDTDREFGASHTRVVEQREDVQAGGVDLGLLTGPRNHGRGERDARRP